MKNIFSHLKRLNGPTVNLLFLSSLLSQQLALHAADSNGKRFERNIPSQDTKESSNHFKQPPGGYYSPDQLLFPIDQPAVKKGSHDQLMAQTEPRVDLPLDNQAGNAQATDNAPPPKSILINFNNVSIIEYIRFISRVTNKNFVFDENDLQFNVTIISEEPATLEDIITALLQELRIHGLTLLEQGNNLIIHKNPKVNAVSEVISDDIISTPRFSEIVTRVFKLNTADPSNVASVIKPLTSEFALVEVLPGTSNLIITDLSTNVAQIAKLIKSVDAPSSGLVIGQYVVRTTSPDTLIDMAKKIITPISQDQPFTMVPWGASNSIFIVSTPYIVERTLSILQHIDQNQKSTKIFDLHELKYQDQPLRDLPPPTLNINGEPYTPTQEELESRGLQPQAPFFPLTPGERSVRGPSGPAGSTDTPGTRGIPGGPTFPGQEPSAPFGTPGTTEGFFAPGRIPSGQWQLTPEGEWIWQTTPDVVRPSSNPPSGRWQVDSNGNWIFMPGEEPAVGTEGEAPRGQWILEPSGSWSYKLEEGESISVKRITRQQRPNADIPLGVKRKCLFSVYKLQYRRGDAIQVALQQIASSLIGCQDVNQDLIDSLGSVQWLETSNSLVFTGYKETLIKMRQLMNEIDSPLRQVFIEMLVLETTIEDALEYSVTWGTRFAGDHWAGGEGFNQTGGQRLTSPINSTLNLAGNDGVLGAAVANNFFGTQGLNVGVIGQKIVNTSMGIEFHSIGALVQAVRFKNNTNVILNPKIITEDSVPAEIFVGENIAFKTQSISNDIGNNITSNFQYRDVGTRFRVTPRLGNNDIITLDIAQEISAVIPTAPSGGNINNEPQGPNTTKSTTTTRVHLPSGYFLIISGMLRDQFDQAAIQVPCLGAIPVIGAAFKDKAYGKRKRNQMIFIRPVIIETEEEIQNLTRHQQDIWEFKKHYPIKKDWIYETERALDFLNLCPSPLRDCDPIDEDIDI